jgi:transcriptional regulator with XRE-family HTH domain
MTKTLSERDIGEIVKLRGLGYTQEEIANRLGVTSATISYQLKRINKVAREEGDNDALITFLFGAGVGFLLAGLLSGSKKGGDKGRE